MKLFESNKQITFKLDIYNGKIEFLRRVQEFHNYIYSDIFPRNLLEYLKNLLRSYLFNPELKKKNMKVIKTL